MIGDCLPADVGAPVRTIFKQRHNAALAFFLMLAQDQAGKELLVGKILAAEPGPALLQTCPGHRIGGIERLPW